VPGMSDGYERVGAPPVAPRKTARRRRIWPVLLGLAISFALLGAVGVAVMLGWRVASDPQPAAARVAMDEAGTCALLIPALSDVTDDILAVVKYPDGSTVDWARVEKTIGDLKTIRDVAPEHMSKDIDNQIGPMENLLARHNGTAPNGDLVLEDLRASGLVLGGRCLKYGR